MPEYPRPAKHTAATDAGSPGDRNSPPPRESHPANHVPQALSVGAHSGMCVPAAPPKRYHDASASVVCPAIGCGELRSDLGTYAFEVLWYTLSVARQCASSSVEPVGWKRKFLNSRAA